jgi:hypothetical protein
MTERLPVPTELNWVKARAECSLVQAFKTLQLGVQTDIDEINSRIQPGIQMKFYLANHGKRFVAVCEVNGAPSHEIEFGLKDDSIVVVEDRAVKFEAHVTLNSAGECKLQVNGEEMEHWQVRRKALEGLFFDKNRGRYL